MKGQVRCWNLFKKIKRMHSMISTRIFMRRLSRKLKLMEAQSILRIQISLLKNNNKLLPKNLSNPKKNRFQKKRKPFCLKLKQTPRETLTPVSLMLSGSLRKKSQRKPSNNACRSSLSIRTGTKRPLTISFSRSSPN